MDIEFVTGLWTRISDHLEKNHAKIAVSRNEPFSGQWLGFFDTRESITLINPLNESVLIPGEENYND